MPPTAQAEKFTVWEGQTRSLEVTRNIPNDSFRRSSLMVAKAPAHGTAKAAPDGTVRYTGKPNYFGEDAFTYSIADAAGNRSQAVVSLTVEAVNDEPVVDGGIPDQQATVGRQTIIQIPSNAFADADPGTQLSLTAQTPLPPGLNFEDTKIVGVPQQPGRHEVVIRAEDEAGAAAATRFRLTIEAPS